MRPPKVALACLLLAISCSGPEDSRSLPADRRVAAGPDIALPAPVPASPAFLVVPDEPLAPEQLESFAGLSGVQVVAPVSLEEMSVEGPHGNATLTVGAVDPLVYRSLAPPPTREVPSVWSALLAGKAVMTFEAADELGVEGPVDLELEGSPVSLGAVADNAVPNLADVLVDRQTGAQIGLDGRELAVIGARMDADSDKLRTGLSGSIGDARLVGLLFHIPEILQPGTPEPIGEDQGVVEAMSFRVLEDGFIDPRGEWVEENIVTGEVPILGEVTCHRLLLPQLQAALGEIEQTGLSELIDPGDYGGCYVPRFIDRDPSNPLSMHAFGLAFDVNVSSNLLGTAGDMDPRLVELLQSWGFVWGGEWERPDPMHFELARLIERAP